MQWDVLLVLAWLIAVLGAIDGHRRVLRGQRPRVAIQFILPKLRPASHTTRGLNDYVEDSQMCVERFTYV